MKQPSDFIVTQENFYQCWDYVDAQRRKGRVKSAIASIGGFWANLFLLAALLFAGNGLIYLQFSGPYREFLEWIPFFLPVWEPFSAFLLNPGDTLTSMAVKTLLGAYVLSIVFFILLALLITLVYHPRKKVLPQCTYQEAAEQLAKVAEDARSYSYKTRLSTSLGAMVIAIVAAFALLFAYIVYQNDMTASLTLLSQFPTADPATNCVLYVLMAYFVIDFFSSLLFLLSRFIYRFEFPFDLLVRIQTAALCAKEDLPELTPEELALRHAATGEALRVEALELEKQNAYGSAKLMLHKAALFGDVVAMEHYARHCLLSHLTDSARYWLDRVSASGQASKEAKSMLLRMKLRLRHNVEYLRPDQVPPSTGQRIWRAIKMTVSIVWRVLIFSVFLVLLYALIQYIRSGFDPASLEWIYALLK